MSQELSRPHPASPSVDPLKSGRSKYRAAWKLSEGIERDTYVDSPANSLRVWRPPMRGKRSSLKATAPPHPSKFPASGAQAERMETDMSAPPVVMDPSSFFHPPEGADASIAAIHFAKLRISARVTGSLALHSQIATPARFYLSPLCVANLKLTANQTVSFIVSVDRQLPCTQQEVMLQITPPPNIGLCFDVSCEAIAAFPAGLTQCGWAFILNNTLVMVMSTTGPEDAEGEFKPVSAGQLHCNGTKKIMVLC